MDELNCLPVKFTKRLTTDVTHYQNVKFEYDKKGDKDRKVVHITRAITKRPTLDEQNCGNVMP